MTGIWETADTITKARMNEKTIFQGTGSAISTLASTYSGMLAFCTSNGNGFIADNLYQRDSANASWNIVGVDKLPYLLLSTTIGDYTSPVSSTATSGAGSVTLEYLVVGGGAGGGGANGNGAGGGGAGGYLTSSFSRGAGAYTVTVGAGGGGGGVGGQGTNGGNSVFDTITSTGGGGGGYGESGAATGNGSAGGSGGGSGGGTSGSPTGGSGTGGQGNNGATNGFAGGGGGGATAAGSGTTGGAGTASSISGASVTYAAGGNASVASPTAGTTNRGNGGEGKQGIGTAGSGGSGIVIIKYLTASATNTGGTITYDGSYTIATFTASDTFTLLVPGAPANVWDTNTATYWSSNSEANPAIYVDLTSAREIVGIALNINKTATTVTSLKIRASTDTTFTDGETVAYVNISDFTDDAWRFMAINFLTENKRYVQIYGNETGVLSINEIKVRYGISDLVKFLSHRHRTRATSGADSFTDSN